ncbi:anti-repressor SinI family protein [Neobacillus sp. PS3-12]|uniref:anti-repressor SinI family protein n=1 Tax=Neobacillus sp. PS3-12 TaxID=3070677 RepID=UPI0027E061B3|nr:anti-repressor SinI family protein [Neobacillus sp. PS3-12]WML51624.1 anti-repressor SinI family protein [Neobacillus sp. PS3-12]
MNFEFCIHDKSFLMGRKYEKKETDLPKEWVELVKQAMESNITKEDFKIFLENEKEKRKNK